MVVKRSLAKSASSFDFSSMEEVESFFSKALPKGSLKNCWSPLEIRDYYEYLVGDAFSHFARASDSLKQHVIQRDGWNWENSPAYAAFLLQKCRDAPLQCSVDELAVMVNKFFQGFDAEIMQNYASGLLLQLTEAWYSLCSSLNSHSLSLPALEAALLRQQFGLDTLTPYHALFIDAALHCRQPERALFIVNSDTVALRFKVNYRSMTAATELLSKDTLEARAKSLFFVPAQRDQEELVFSMLYLKSHVYWQLEDYSRALREVNLAISLPQAVNPFKSRLAVMQALLQLLVETPAYALGARGLKSPLLNRESAKSGNAVEATLETSLDACEQLDVEDDDMADSLEAKSKYVTFYPPWTDEINWRQVNFALVEEVCLAPLAKGRSWHKILEPLLASDASAQLYGALSLRCKEKMLVALSKTFDRLPLEDLAQWLCDSVEFVEKMLERLCKLGRVNSTILQVQTSNFVSFASPEFSFCPEIVSLDDFVKLRMRMLPSQKSSSTWMLSLQSTIEKVRELDYNLHKQLINAISVHAPAKVSNERSNVNQLSVQKAKNKVSLNRKRFFPDT